MENWKSIEGYEGLYEVSDFGRVRSFHSSTRRRSSEPHILSGGNTRGYRTVILCKGGEHRAFLVHQLVARTFLGIEPTPGHTVNHKDFDKANNRLENLHWITQADNVRYSKDVIPRNRGEANHSKLTEAEVREMRSLAELGYGCVKLGKRFGVSDVTAWKIVKRQKWAHLQ